MKNWFGWASAMAACTLCTPLWANSTETLFKSKNWEVELVSFDDGSVACLAEVDATVESFTIWIYPDQSARLQFYSTSWDYGDTGDTANLDVRIDKRKSWQLSNAELFKNSILFNLPDSDDGVRFLTEVAQGQRLYLRSEDGTPVQDYSLQGSRASMDALIVCADAIR